MSASCSCVLCLTDFSATAEMIVCSGYNYNNEEGECEHTHGEFMCTSCAVFDDKDEVYRCPGCQEQAYFLCDCCGEKKPMECNTHMGTCYSELKECTCENMCRDCAVWNDEVDNYVCYKCDEKMNNEEEEEEEE